MYAIRSYYATAEFLRGESRDDHADGDCLAVLEQAVAGQSFDSVTEGVPVVENRAQGAFFLVLFYNIRLNLARFHYRVDKRLALELPQRITLSARNNFV